VDLDVVFLGTSASMPTARRGTSSLMLRRGGDRVLVDCGEGTQRQLLRSSVGLVDLEDVLLTHFHADHVLGLPGMLKSFALRGRELPITVHGPPGLRELFGSLRRMIGRLSYDLVLVELEPGEAIERGEYRIEAFAVDHADALALGFALVEAERPGRFDPGAARELGVPEGPLWGVLQRGAQVTLDDGRAVVPAQVLGPARSGRRLVVTGDTRPCRSVVEAANGADLLVHEGTFGSEEQGRALETGHSTAQEAAEIARFAGVALLALTHLSSRYAGPELADEARAIFPDTVVPRDLDTVEIPFAERGPPRLVKGGAAPAREPRQEAVPVAEPDG
jgi:ribonuclease Z